MTDTITTELREYAHDCCARVDDAIHDIADRIDAEHERQCAESWMRGHDAWAAIDRSDDMAEHGWIRLPVDADGEYIRVGDVVEWCDNGETLTVEGVGNDVLFYIDGENAEWTAARNKRHHHAPTVEDVLGEFFEEVGDGLHILKAVDTQAIIAKYAAKLRLAGDAE